MPRKIRPAEVQSKALDYALLIISVFIMGLSVVFVYFLLTTLTQFEIVPFTEFAILFLLGVLGIRTWRKETTT
jgi:cytochrome c biogenesis protein CcdA